MESAGDMSPVSAAPLATRKTLTIKHFKRQIKSLPSCTPTIFPGSVQQHNVTRNNAGIRVK